MTIRATEEETISRIEPAESPGTTVPAGRAAVPGSGGTVKCVVWDLDDTVWTGTLLEGDRLTLRSGIREALERLDERGVLNSIASRNDEAPALAELERLGVAEYFLYPQINWGPKSASVARVAEALNIDTNAMAFVDDQAYEREEVAFALPEVLCLDADTVIEMLDTPALTPRFVTPESHQRRLMYVGEARRRRAEAEFDGPGHLFMMSLGMVLRVSDARKEDLQRGEELTIRTHQLNSTGLTYSYEELDALRTSDRHRLLTASLTDRFGSYGTIGLAVLESDSQRWCLKLLLTSCRVIARGVPGMVLGVVLRLARDAGVTLQADLVETDRNRTMYVLYKFAGFREVERQGSRVTFEHDLVTVPPLPKFATVIYPGAP